MKRLLVAVITLIGFVSPAWAGPNDLFGEKVMDFGTTPKGPILVHYFRFTNNGKETITVGNPRVSCGCVTATMSKAQIAPGESAAVIAQMDTRRIPNVNVPKSVLIYVPFLAPTQEEVTLRVQTIARDDLLMSPDTIAFGSVKAGTGGTSKTQVTFLSDPNWKVTAATTTGGFVTAEPVEKTRSGNLVTYEITATLDKTCPAGNWVSEIQLTTSNPAVAKLRIPVTVNVTPLVALTPDRVSFGNMAVGSESERKITIKGGAPFKILEIKGTDEQLRVTVDKVEASDEHIIVLAANPKSAGGFDRTVVVLTDDKDQPKLIIPVTAKVLEK